MVRWIGALVLVLLVVSPSFGQQPLVGTYKLVSLVPMVEGKQYELMGKAPHGYLVITPTHFIYFVTADNRKFGTSVAEKAALLDSMVAYAGVYRIEGNKIFQTMDVSFTENQNGTTRVDTFEFSGGRLTFKSDPMPFPRDPSKTYTRLQVFEKIE
ncbi:MAG TPA: lipocalin-like domain-containing protein [Syntrophorhabdales bacterium]|nr:lipocalin-like domain-containing protein [Syntrophorhabdales bacterium]